MGGWVGGGKEGGREREGNGGWGKSEGELVVGYINLGNLLIMCPPSK